jgi:hypothetical protein
LSSPTLPKLTTLLIRTSTAAALTDRVEAALSSPTLPKLTTLLIRTSTGAALT